jgi:two-component system, NarL family, nitrate/nitrite response regulator NarL
MHWASRPHPRPGPVTPRMGKCGHINGVTESRPRLLIIEDHILLAQAVASSFTGYGFTDTHVVHAAELDDDGILAEAERLRPDVVLLDLHFGGDRYGLPLIGPLRRLGSTVLVLSAAEDRMLLAEAARQGADGLMGKAEPFDQLVDAVRRLAGGDQLLSDAARQQLVAELDHRARDRAGLLARFAALTAAEQAVLAALLDAQAPKQIAAARNVSVSTIRNQIQSVLSKLGVNREREAVSLAREAGWIPPTDR